MTSTSAASLERISGRSSGWSAFSAAQAPLPLRQRTFTHVWAVEGMADLSLADSRLHELIRVVRLGGMAMVQQSGVRPGWTDATCDAMTAVGFAEVAAEVVEQPPLRESIRR